MTGVDIEDGTVRWRCPKCVNLNLNDIKGTPWKCSRCNHLDRSVESQVDQYLSWNDQRGEV